MTLSSCPIRLRDSVPVCQTCGLVVGEKSAGVDCPRRREAYGIGAAFDARPVRAEHTMQAFPEATR